ncbi:MAG: hypothetical protein IJJ59_12095 [Pseudobutyrivibrio sp.]|uniref:hypothetical protein n=1 Tax=Pseudobutyrivibrio sp. TaxID=2014367 RepID=UPI0025DB62DB|nr:hypothetical protein [Pseudobutyrivibrio sp.]MBQ6464055.1 hypothetical protein [Pseudobutyrivibrio sp.]
MKVITCASFYGSGSSALTDLVAEYSNVKDMTDFEFSILHDMYGIRDLEYYLVENHNRHNSGHALKRFEKLLKFNGGNALSKRYSRFIPKKEYNRICEQYIDELIDFKYLGWWFADLYDKGPVNYYFYQLINKLLKKITFGSQSIMKNEVIYCSQPSEEKFLSATKRFMKNFLSLLNDEDKEYIEIDQLFPSTNIDKYVRYIDEEYTVFVIDRDPRDIYLLNKYVWDDTVCPKEVNSFCDWFIYTRNNAKQKNTNDKVVFLQFEDLIYKYNESLSIIEDKTGLVSSNHCNQFKKFNPKRSIANTRLWEKYNCEEEIQEIEHRLKEYLYDYSLVKTDDIVGLDCEECNQF